MRRHAIGVVVTCGAVVACVVGSGCRKRAPESPAPVPKGEPTTAQPSPSQRKPTLDPRITPVMTDLIAKWDQVQSGSVVIGTKLPDAATLKGYTTGRGTYDFLKRGGKLLIRFFMQNNLHFRTAELAFMSTHELLFFVHDGQFLYYQLQQPQQMKKATKSKYSPEKVLQLGGRDLFDQLRKHDLVLGADEDVDGKSTYVIEAAPVEGAWKARHYFDKQTGIRIQHLEFDAEGNESFRLTVTEVNLQPEFSEGHFTYKLPEGFELTDETTP